MPRGAWNQDRHSGSGQWSSAPGSRATGNVAHNPYEVRMPRFLEAIADSDKGPESTSIIMVDNRDERMVSPFQAWLVSEIMANSASSINVLTERDQVMPPSSGFHLALFANYTLDGIKAVMAISMESETGSDCAGWDGETASALAHPAFQPFTWPMIRDTSASYTDVKVYNGNEILFHWILRGFRSDTDLTVQQQFVDEYLVREVNKGKPRLSVVVAVFMGWRVSVLSYECGGQTYSVGPKGSVVAGDSARSRFELRVCQRSSEDAMGNDADRIEFRFRDANNRIDLKRSRTSVPGTWLTVSHISGPTLIRTIQSVRENRARVEGPEQTEQFAQLAAIHENWWRSSVSQDENEVGCFVEFVEGLDHGNFHVQTRSKLMVRELQIVAKKALAEMQHSGGVTAPSGPPALTGDAWLRSAAQAREDGDDQTGMALISVQQRAGRELNQRSFDTQHDREGRGGHVVDEERDRARRDRRFARSTAQLTPALFAEEFHRRSYNETTATIEELEPSMVQPSSETKKPEKVPQSTPAEAPGDHQQPSTSAPVSFSPQGSQKAAGDQSVYEA